MKKLNVQDAQVAAIIALGTIATDGYIEDVSLELPYGDKVYVVRLSIEEKQMPAHKRQIRVDELAVQYNINSIMLIMYDSKSSITNQEKNALDQVRIDQRAVVKDLEELGYVMFEGPTSTYIPITIDAFNRYENMKVKK